MVFITFGKDNSHLSLIVKNYKILREKIDFRVLECGEQLLRLLHRWYNNFLLVLDRSTTHSNIASRTINTLYNSMFFAKSLKL